MEVVCNQQGLLFLLLFFVFVCAEIWRQGTAEGDLLVGFVWVSSEVCTVYLNCVFMCGSLF